MDGMSAVTARIGEIRALLHPPPAARAPAPQSPLGGTAAARVPVAGVPAAGQAFAAALAGRVNALLADPTRAAAMGRAGRLRAVEHFGWPAVAARTVALYEKLVS